MKHCLVLAWVFWFGMSWAVAEEAKKDAPQAAESGIAASREEFLKDCEKLVGTWGFEGESPDEVGKFTMEWTFEWALNKTCLKFKGALKGEKNSVAMEGYMAWDADLKKAVMLSLTSEGEISRAEQVESGDRKIAIFDWTASGGMMKEWREVITEVDADHSNFEWKMKQDGALVTFFKGVYTRKK